MKHLHLYHGLLVLLLVLIGCSAQETREGSSEPSAEVESEGRTGAEGDGKTEAAKADEPVAPDQVDTLPYKALLKLLSKPGESSEEVLVLAALRLSRIAPKGDKEAIRVLLRLSEHEASVNFRARLKLVLFYLGHEDDTRILVPSEETEKQRIMKMIELLNPERKSAGAGGENEYLETQDAILKWLKANTDGDFGLDYDKWVIWFNEKFPQDEEKE
jgi:hypothetical protein